MPKLQRDHRHFGTAVPFLSCCLDAQAAEAAAEVMARVNQSCSDASYLKVMAIAILVAFVLSFVPLWVSLAIGA